MQNTDKVHKDKTVTVTPFIYKGYYYDTISVQNKTRRLVVSDEGIGMTSETIINILKGPYRSEEAMKFNEKGSGLGLQFVKDIVQRLGANLQIDSVVGHGSKITIQFPQ